MSSIFSRDIAHSTTDSLQEWWTDNNKIRVGSVFAQWADNKLRNDSSVSHKTFTDLQRMTMPRFDVHGHHAQDPAASKKNPLKESSKSLKLSCSNMKSAARNEITVGN